jgi:hypothetical protein
MAHSTQITGAVSELTAAKLLMETLGYEVAKPLVDEVYDFLARDPVNGKAYRIQVKTLRIRADRDNALVVMARKGNGNAYTKDEVDYIIGVDGNRAFMFECRNKSEYWSTEQTAKERWIDLSNEGGTPCTQYMV